ncbi:MAG: M50 family metallopeptidase [Clostridiaceae bacterium]
MEENDRSDKVKRKKKRVLGVIYLAICIALGILLGYLPERYGLVFKPFEGISFSDIVLMLIQIYVGIFLLVNIHELGHFLMGKLMGYRLLMIRAGIFSLQRENDKLKLNLVKNVGYGGLCAMIPPNGSTLNQYALYSSGGILFNLIFGIMLIIIVPYFNLSEVYFIPSMLTGYISIFFSIINAIPYLSMNQPTDGMVILSILKKAPIAERFYRNNLVSKQIMEGKRPKDLELKDLDDHDPIDLSDHILLLYHYFKEVDSGNLEKAGEYLGLLRNNLGKIPPFALPAYHYELIFYFSLMKNEEEAKKYYSLSAKVLHRDQDINGLRVKAYFEYAINHDCEKAMELARKGLDVKNKYPFPGQAIMEGNLLEILIDKCKCDAAMMS